MLCGQHQQVEQHPPVLQFCSAIHRKFANKQQIFAQSDFSDKKCTTRCRQQLQNVTVNNKLRRYSHSHTLRKDENDSTKSADYEAGDIKLQTQVYYSLYRSTPRLTHTQLFNGPLSGTTQVSRYQKGKTSLDFTEARDSGWQWHQLGYMQVCISLQTDNHTSSPPLLCFFTGRMPFLPPNQQRQSTEGTLVQKQQIKI